MSGEKRTTVTIDSDLYRRLNTSEKQLQQIRRDLPDLLQSLNERAAQDVARRLGPLEERQRQISQATEGMRGEVRDFYRSVNGQLAGQQQEFRRSVDGLRSDVQELASSTSSRFEQQRRDFNDKLNSQRQEMERQIQGVAGRVSDLEQGEAQRSQMAADWIEGAQQVLEGIAASPRHPLFLPGRLDGPARSLEQARGNLSRNAAQAALALAQTAAFELADLQAELQMKEQEWQGWRASAERDLAKLLGLAESNRSTGIFDLKGNKLKGSFDVDYWSQGGLSALAGRARQMAATLNDSVPPLPTADLRRMVEEAVPAMEKELDEAVLQARAAILGSQLRVNIADLIVGALEEQGFGLEDGTATYEGQDARNRYLAKVLHEDGGEVTVCVEPVEGKPDQNTVRIESYDADHLSPQELDARKDEIAQALRAQGLEMGQMHEGGRPDPKLRDLKPLAQPAPQPQAQAQPLGK